MPGGESPQTVRDWGIVGVYTLLPDTMTREENNSLFKKNRDTRWGVPVVLYCAWERPEKKLTLSCI